jgi:hypothetical protein
MDPKTPAGIRYLISFSVDQVDESTFNEIEEVSMGSMIEQTQVSKVLDHQKFIYDDKPSEKYTIILNSESPYSIYIQNMFFIYYENTIIHSNCMTITRSEKISLQDLKKFSDVKYKEVCTPFFESVKFNQVQ